ncbi:hypothetical protein [Kitasatospora paranensis]|uniref:hypothetical protein n=1 Tax=Kitasatospora paranensis TaxID=258053 RepID=UPI0031ECCA90
MTPLTEASAETHLAGICFKIGPPALVGVEAEWFVHDTRCPEAPVDPARTAAALAALPDHPDGPRFPAGSRFTREPGGQVELSSRPSPPPPTAPRTSGATRPPCAPHSPPRGSG